VAASPAAARKEAVRMRSVLSVCLLIIAPIGLGCVSAPHPQPLVRSTPVEKSVDVAIDSPTASDRVGKTVAETNSSTTLSSRFTKLFSRADSSDRIPLPRNDQRLENGSESAQRDLGRDF
jgi:hypothetical protein